VERAHAIGGTSTVITFHPHPLQVLARDNAPRLIQTLDQKLATIESMGIQLVVVIPFDQQFAQTSAQEFASTILGERLRIHEIHVGPNFAFGHRREGSFNLLKEMGAEKGFQVYKIQQMQFRGMRISSTAVRQALVSGQVALARRLLGRPFELQGVVVHGAARGKLMKVPTANLRTPNELIPRKGIYVTMARVDARRMKSVTSIGIRPTFSSVNETPILTIETHILDLEQDLYGRQLNLEFFLRLRDERRFENQEGLVDWIRRDVARARRFFHWREKAAGPGRPA
jgi:riboflavin kinase/FMN adenylyltransferase